MRNAPFPTRGRVPGHVLEHPHVDVAVDIAAGQDDAHALALPLRRLEERGEGRGPRALGELVRGVEVRAHRRLDLLVGYFDDVVRAGEDDVERRLDGHAHRHAVGDVTALAVSIARALAERLRIRIRVRRHDADDPRREPKRVARGR